MVGKRFSNVCYLLNLVVLLGVLGLGTLPNPYRINKELQCENYWGT